MRMMTIVVCLFVAVVCSAPANAQNSTTGILRGRVVDSYEHVSIIHALIFVHGFGGFERSIEVDNQGRFSTELTAGVYDVFVSTSGFDPACRKIEVLPDKTSVYKVVMKASAIGAQD